MDSNRAGTGGAASSAFKPKAALNWARSELRESSRLAISVVSRSCFDLGAQDVLQGDLADFILGAGELLQIRSGVSGFPG